MSDLQYEASLESRVMELEEVLEAIGKIAYLSTWTEHYCEEDIITLGEGMKEILNITGVRMK